MSDIAEFNILAERKSDPESSSEKVVFVLEAVLNDDKTPHECVILGVAEEKEYLVREVNLYISDYKRLFRG